MIRRQSPDCLLITGPAPFLDLIFLSRKYLFKLFWVKSVCSVICLLGRSWHHHSMRKRTLNLYYYYYYIMNRRLTDSCLPDHLYYDCSVSAWFIFLTEHQLFDGLNVSVYSCRSTYTAAWFPAWWFGHSDFFSSLVKPDRDQSFKGNSFNSRRAP